MNKPLTLSSLFASLLLLVTATDLANAQTCVNANILESTPTSRYTFSASDTVTDNTTNLMWKRCLEGQTFSDNGTANNYLDDFCMGSATTMNWGAALNRAQTANTSNDSGHNDWRVPNLKELKSMVEYCRANPTINTEVFPGAPPSYVWSGSPVTEPSFGYESGSWAVNFYSGSDFWGYRIYDYHVRLVRSGQ